MNEIIEKDIEKKIYTIRGMEVMLDSDIACLYQVETKRINEAVKNNPDKFPERYSFKLTEEELNNLWSKFSTANISSKARTTPTVFTERGLYMLATILKSPVATKVTIAIMDTFVRMRHYINYNKEMLPHRLMLLEDKVSENTNNINKLFDMFNPNEIAKEYLFFNNELFKANYVLFNIFDSAKKEIIIIDNYADRKLLKELSEINKDITLVSKNVKDELVNKYKSEYNNIKFINKDIYHDRFIIIDKKKLYVCGASFKDLGKKCFAICEIEDKYYLEKIIESLENIE